MEPFKPGRSISGFRTGPLGMGHAVLTVERLDDVAPFYADVLGFQLSDYILRPFNAYFFHVNPRHHSLAFIATGKNGIHHLIVELCYLDDVGQAYDLALRQPETIGTTLGRHTNDQVTSFYSWSPSKFLVEYGWGGRSIDPQGWTPHERVDGPSLWGHDRMWLTPEGREEARDLRIGVAEAGGRVPLHVMDGNYLRARDVCRGGTPTSRRGRPDSGASAQPRRTAVHWPAHWPVEVRHCPLPLLPTSRPEPLAERPASATVTRIEPFAATAPAS